MRDHDYREGALTLEPGDIVMTGTPRGVSTYERGDRFVVEIFDQDAILLKKSWSVTE